MLTAVVLHLRPVAETRLPISHGAFAYAAASNLILRRDPRLSHALHQAEGRKPFTCSPLMRTERREGYEYVLTPDQVYPWRLTGLTEEVSRHLVELSPDLGGINFQEAVFSIDHVSMTAEDHPEAGRDTYEALLARWERREPPEVVTLHFLSPTTFRIDRLEQPFALPRWVFGSLLSTWNAFAPDPYSLGEWSEALEEQIVLSNWRGETRRVELGGHRTVGFIGKFAYRVIKPMSVSVSESASASTPTPARETAKLLGLLAEFSFYAGVGWQTTHGLGQVRPQLPQGQARS
jgi:CRISPR-associated endoribonuclease Cas6